MYKKDLALNNLQWLIYYKTKLNPTKAPTIKKKKVKSIDIWMIILVFWQVDWL